MEPLPPAGDLPPVDRPPARPPAATPGQQPGVQPPAPPASPASSQQYTDWREQRRAERRARREERRGMRASWGTPWLGGLILIALGLLLLAQNFGLLDLANWNWWVLFILIPAVAAFAEAWREFQAEGEWSRPARWSLTAGVVLGLLSLALFFGWSRFWPLLLILAGAGVLWSTTGN